MVEKVQSAIRGNYHQGDKTISFLTSFSHQDEKLLAATRGKKMKDTTLLSLQTKREEAGSLLASAEAR